MTFAPTNFFASCGRGRKHRHKITKNGLLCSSVHYRIGVCTWPTLSGAKHFIITTTVSLFTIAQIVVSHTYIKRFPIKRVVSISRDETTMLRALTTTTCTAGIPTRPGSLYPMLVPRTQCYKWTKPDTLQFRWKNDHSKAIPLAAKCTLNFFFSDWKCITCDVTFMDWVTKWQRVFVWKWL